ncbi:MAG: FAD-dependent oxidoreductase [Alphaproteobacteria bacterium]|nr:FAD-dependent oxidoreductase [Alphaproteobacteria bacterium]
MRVGVLGGGLCGLAVAGYSRHDCEVLEADSRPGGHCQSLVQDGYTFDVGGPHILFSRNQEVLKLMLDLLGDNIETCRRNSKIFYKGRYVKYPFENGLYDLAPEDRFACLYHYVVNDYPAPTNFKEWIYHTFGKGIAEAYMLPYNEKIWNVTADQMSMDWVEGRVPRPPVEDVIKSAVGVETEGYTHQLNFQYPRSGGIECVPRAFARKCRKIVCDFHVSKVWREKDEWCVGDGKTVKRYDRLVTTIPIDNLLSALPGVPRHVLDACAALRFNSIITVMLGVARQDLPMFSSMYVPDREYLFHRLSWPNTFTPEGAPQGCTAIMAEITTNAGDGVHELSDEALYAHCIEGLTKMGMVDADAIRFKAIHRTKFAYVVRTFDYATHLKTVLDYVSSLGIVSVGRNAEFEYINMDEAVRRSLEVVKRIDREWPIAG